MTTEPNETVETVEVPADYVQRVHEVRTDLDRVIQQNRVSFRMQLVTILVVLPMLALTGWLLSTQRAARATLLDCVQPTGKCAQEAAKSTGNVGGAVSFCSATLPPTATVQESFNCFLQTYSQPVKP